MFALKNKVFSPTKQMSPAELKRCSFGMLVEGTGK